MTGARFLRRLKHVRAVACCIVALALHASGCSSDRAVTQPIEFNHKIHVTDEKIPCTDCHMGAEKQVHASLPALSRCLMCHMKPQSKVPNPREQRVRELAASREPVRWTQITRNAGHVYFSHRAHVALAKMPCSDCHGDVANWTKPPTKPVAALLSMGACLSCHRDEGASTACATCHQ
jgi:menaquinone reductase, multiheme cytochrome c subunit